MFMLDATVNEYMVPIDELYGYFAYRGGQSVWWYIANKYGRREDRGNIEQDQVNQKC